MPRLFSGLSLPETQRTALAIVQHGVPGARWIDPHDFHITLRFIGDVDLRTANDVVEILGSRPWDAPPIQLGELAVFGGKKPTSLFASVKENEELDSLQRGHERLMQQLGLPADSRQFTPHVTIGRVRSVKPPVLATFLSHHGGISIPAFKALHFNLYSARESKGGGPYRVEKSWPLNPGDQVSLP